MFLKLWRKFFQPRRYVWLIDFQGDLKIARAYRSQVGWIARKYNEETWNILLPDGTTKGYSCVKKWLPHKGWGAAEQESLEKFYIEYNINDTGR